MLPDPLEEYGDSWSAGRHDTLYIRTHDVEIVVYVGKWNFIQISSIATRYYLIGMPTHRSLVRNHVMECMYRWASDPLV
jgi:hypothetical protein